MGLKPYNKNWTIYFIHVKNVDEKSSVNVCF